MNKLAVVVVALVSLGIMANKCELNSPLMQKEDQKQEQPAPAPADQPK